MTLLPTVSPDLRDAGSNSFLLRHVQTLGIALGEMDYLRGHKDDFFGDQIADQYTSVANGVGSFVVLLDAVHGGAVSLTSGPGVGRFAQLWLGDAADGHDSLSADPGYVIIGYHALSDGGNISGRVGVSNAAKDRYLLVGADTAVGGNWYLWCRAGALPAGLTTVDSGIAIDTDYHWHVIDVYPTSTGRRADYYLDGAPVATSITNIEAAAFVRTPFVECLSPGAWMRAVALNYWAAIPR